MPANPAALHLEMESTRVDFDPWLSDSLALVTLGGHLISQNLSFPISEMESITPLPRVSVTRKRYNVNTFGK